MGSAGRFLLGALLGLALGYAFILLLPPTPSGQRHPQRGKNGARREPPGWQEALQE